jgi:Ca2+-binding RTX toxin-like protein
MASFVVSGETTAGQLLLAGEQGSVLANGGLVTVGPAITVNGSASVLIAGLVSGSTIGITANTAAHYTIAASGTLVGGTDRALNIVAPTGTSNLINAGLIDGATAGVSFSGSGLNIVNSGTISGSGSTGIITTATAFLDVTNTGLITGTNYGILAGGTGLDVIVNAGVIQGTRFALDLSDGVSKVTNTGVLAGGVDMGAGDDTFNGTHGVQFDVFGNNGNDTIAGGMGDEHLDGGTGTDQLRGFGGDDFVYGDTGNDLLSGGLGDDTVSGGTGADTVSGGAGNDTLTGGAQGDVFVFGRGQGFDLVSDFQDASDLLNLKAFGFGSATAVISHASAAAGGLLIDLTSFGGGTIQLQGMTLAQLSGADLIL